MTHSMGDFAHSMGAKLSHTMGGFAHTMGDIRP